MISLICEIKKNKINEQNRKKFIDSQNKLMVAKWEEIEDTNKKGEGIKINTNCQLWKLSRACEVHHREYSQGYYYNYVWYHMGTRLTGVITL